MFSQMRQFFASRSVATATFPQNKRPREPETVYQIPKQLGHEFDESQKEMLRAANESYLARKNEAPDFKKKRLQSLFETQKSLNVCTIYVYFFFPKRGLMTKKQN